MKARLLSFTLLAVGLIGPTTLLLVDPLRTAQASTPAAVPDPAQQIQHWGRLFRAGNVPALVQALVPASKWEQAKLGYELVRLQPTTAEDQARFRASIERFVAPDAAGRLMQELEPELEKLRPQAPGAVQMAFGAMQVALASPENTLDPEQRVALQAALPGFQQWASHTDFLSADTLRHALTLLTDAARGTGIRELDQIKALPLEGVLDRATPVLAAAKQALRLYGLDLDAIADSLVVQTLEQGIDTARVRTTVTVFGAPVWHDHELVLIEGRWYGKHLIDHVQIEGVARAD